MTPPASDTQLALWLEQIARGDAQALRKLFDATASRLKAVAMRVLSNHGLAEDAVQDAYMTVWRIAGDYRQQLSPPLVWLGLITRSRALDLARRRNVDKSLGTDNAELLDVLDFADDDSDPMTQHADSELVAALHRCLRRIEVKQREALVLAYFRDLSHTDIAHEMKVPLGTAKAWLRRSMDKLRMCLQDGEKPSTLP